MKVAIYTRISTQEQSSDMQLCELRSYAKLRNWEIISEYSDTISGAARVRPGLESLRSDAHRRRFEAVLVWKFDRFARSLKHLLDALDEFKSLGINFISLHDAGVDTTTPTGGLIFAVLGAVAEFERSIIRERVKAGVAHAKAKRGCWGPRSKHRSKVEKAAVLHAGGNGLGYGRIAEQLQCSKTTVRRLLKMA